MVATTIREAKQTGRRREVIYTANDLVLPVLAGYIRSIEPDTELERLMGEYDVLDGRLRRLSGQGNEIRNRIRTIDVDLLNAGSREKTTLLGKRAELTSELASLPAQVAELAKQHATAHLAYLARVAAIASAEVQSCEDALEKPRKDLMAVRKLQIQMDDYLPHGNDIVNPEEDAARRREIQIITDLRPNRERLDRCQLVANVARTRAVWTYGEDFGLQASNSWRAAIQRASLRAIQALERVGA